MGGGRAFDEPQHIKQGEIQEKLLDTLEIPYEIIDSELKNYNLISNLISKSKNKITCKKKYFLKCKTKI